jgi:exopolyphosphatase/guanosine-5'-triphosphate,3'-diphosphate pyrophosphatase
MSQVTAIDLGSNSFRVLKYDCKENIGLEDFETAVGTADGLQETGKISDAAVQRIIDAINLSTSKIGYNTQTAIAKTTQAMRKASNSQEVIQKIQKETGLLFEIIEADEEARLTLLAVIYALKRHNMNDKKFILVDIGGGSTELVIKDNYKVYKKSFELGIVTLSQTPNKEDALEKYKNQMLDFVKEQNINLDEFDFVSTAGTPTTVAALKLGMNYSTYDKHKINGTKVTLEDIDNCYKIFEENDTESLKKLVGTGRQDYILTGVKIFETIYEILEKKSSSVFDDGLREGIAINSCMNS